MRVHATLTDDDGQEWEFEYEENLVYVVGPDGAQVLNERGAPKLTSEVVNLRYRREGTDSGWSELPPWADIREEWKINLCLFDEDEETEEMTFWEVSS